MPQSGALAARRSPNVEGQIRAQRRIAAMSTFTIQHEQEEDGRWIAEVPELPGVLAYGATADEAMAKAEVLALRVLAERLEHKEAKPQSITIGIAAA
jgi:predicted RNase H-like HicB family nuclease